MNAFKVKGIWLSVSSDMLIVLLVPIDSNRTLRNDLLWYTSSEFPDWKIGQELSDKDFLDSYYYKQTKMKSIAYDIPDFYVYASWLCI